MANNAFEGSNIKKVKLPSSMLDIKTAFNNTYIEEIVIPHGISAVKKDAFKDSGLRSVEIPGSLKHILSLTFMDCGSLKDIYLHDGTVIIDDEAFSGAREVNKVIIPDSVEYVGAGVFLSQKYNFKNFKRFGFRNELVKPMRRYPNDMIILMYLTKLFFDKKEEESFCRVADNTDVTEADLAFYEEFKERMNSFINYGINIALPVDDRNRLRNWSHYIKPQGTYTEELRDCGWKMFRDYSEWLDMHKHTLADLLRGEHTSIEYETPTGPMVLNDAVLDPPEKPETDSAER